MTDNLPPETLDELRSYIERDVTAGFLTAEEIVQSAVDVLEEEADLVLLTVEAQRICAEAFRQHVEAQRNWPAVTDCDKLDQAFENLEASGVIARQNFTCCGTCGVAEIEDEIQQALSAGRKATGYAFYHAQDTESAAEGHGVHLNYGSVEDSEQAALAVGHSIMDALRACGLSPAWDGTLGKRIALPLDWKRRRGAA